MQQCAPVPPQPSDGRKQTVSDFFTRASTIWEDNYTGKAADYRVHFFAQRRRRVMEALGPPAGRRMLDLGCASGDLTLTLAAAGAHAIGADLTPGMVHRAEARRREAPEALRPAAARAAFAIADAESLPFPDGAFDAVACVGVMEYVPDDSRGVRELHRVIRPGGRLVITAPHRHSPALWCELGLFALAGLVKKRPPQAFHRNYSAGRMKRLLESEGFVVRSCRFASYLPYNVALRLPGAPGLDRMLSRVFQGWPAEALGATMVVGADRP